MSKHVLIVGGTRGIGKTIAFAFAKDRYQVSVIGRCPPHPSSQRIHFWKMDLMDRKNLRTHMREIISKNGKLAHLVFCQRFRGDADSFEQEWNLTLRATSDTIEILKDQFEQVGERSIVVIGSVAGTHITVEQPLSYHVCKAALMHLVRYYAVLLGPKGIRVNGVSPCTTVKDESKRFFNKNARLMNLYKKIYPLCRVGTSADVVKAVQFLSGPDSSFITGQNLVVDGGLSLRWPESVARSIEFDSSK